MGGRGSSFGKVRGGRRVGGSTKVKSVRGVRGARDDGTAIIMKTGQRIPYGRRKGFSGPSREWAIEQAKKYVKKPSKYIIQ